MTSEIGALVGTGIFINSTNSLTFTVLLGILTFTAILAFGESLNRKIAADLEVRLKDAKRTEQLVEMLTWANKKSETLELELRKEREKNEASSTNIQTERKR